MSVNSTFGIIIDNSRVMIQTEESLTDDSRGIIYDCNMFIVQTTGHMFLKVETIFKKSNRPFYFPSFLLCMSMGYEM